METLQAVELGATYGVFFSFMWKHSLRCKDMNSDGVDLTVLFQSY